VKQYADLAGVIRRAARSYVDEVREKRFPEVPVSKTSIS
jgi:ketopantoate hydroxymethyltransferase